MEMKCLNCKAVFIHTEFDRTIYCTNCGSMNTCSKCSYDNSRGFERELKDLYKKWGVPYNR